MADFSKQRLDDEREAWALLSMRGLEGAYGEDEVEYSLDLIKKPNPEYEGFNRSFRGEKKFVL